MDKKKQPARKKAIKPGAVKQKPSEAKVAEEQEATFPIVGIGASAGGLAAIEKFFAGMPADSDTGMAFVLVQHLAPDHKSILGDLIRRYTRMKVYEVKDGIKVLPNCAYIIPPNRDMAFLHGSLYLSEPLAPRGLRLPIDFFFRSLAQDQRERAICIVLSGTGSDGTLGLRAIKGEGGMAMAQTPESTEYDGMPRSAVSTGLVDYVMAPGEMPAQLIAYAKHIFGRKPQQVSAPTPKATDLIKKVFILLRAKTGHDFSFYKQNTIVRRIERRMAVHQVERLEDYLRYLQQSPTEVEALFRDLLIGVTSFFRDQDAFNSLQELVVPRLFEKLPRAGTVRAWVPGCSTGEEAYSIAMLLQDHMKTHKQFFKVQIFATDIDSMAISTARAGIYPASIAADVSPERLARYFTLSDDGATYHIQKFIRDMLIFSEQDVIQDPPFSRLGLISCRNLLIYMGTELQKRVLSIFNYALKQDGFLFLGSAESIGELTDAFKAVDRKWKLYQHTEMAYLPPVIRGPAPVLPEEVQAGRPRVAFPPEGRISIRELTERALLRQYAPAGVVINERGETIFIHGSTGKYLELAAGEASVNIMRMAREGLRRQLTTAIRRVAAKKEPVSYQNLQVKANGETIAVNLTVRPFEEDTASTQGLQLVIFEDVPPKGEGVAVAEEAAVTSAAGDERIKALEQELQDKEEYLQVTFEELETSNEELKSTNEELQSANEELGSTNEELETSREELQSINEELSTVNAELQGKVEQLSQSANYMHNLLAGTGVGTIFVDNQMCITFFTPAAAAGRMEAMVDGLKGFEFVKPEEALLEDISRCHTAVHIGDVKRYGEVFDMAMLAAGGAIKAAELAMAGEPAFALIRPPGHHASSDSCWGFCFFNNMAVALARLIGEKKIRTALILDFDLHYGDGTANIFQGNPDVAYFHPEDGDRQDFVDHVGRFLGQSSADIIAVSAGFDRHIEDWGRLLSTEDYTTMGQQVKEFALKNCQGRRFGVLEGGYNHEVLGRNVRAFLEGMA